jgi:hypothetical protein
MFRGRRIERASGGSSTMTVDRRRILQIALGGGSLSPLVLPERWVKPVVRSVIVHAAASPATTTTTTTTPRPSTDSNPNGIALERGTHQRAAGGCNLGS